MEPGSLLPSLSSCLNTIPPDFHLGEKAESPKVCYLTHTPSMMILPVLFSQTWNIPDLCFSKFWPTHMPSPKSHTSTHTPDSLPASSWLSSFVAQPLFDHFCVSYIFSFSVLLILWYLEPPWLGESLTLQGFSQFLDTVNNLPGTVPFKCKLTNPEPLLWTTTCILFFHSTRQYSSALIIPGPGNGQLRSCP